MRNPIGKTLCALALCLPLAVGSGLAGTPEPDISPEGPSTVDYRPIISLGDPVVIQNDQGYATPLLSMPSVNDLELPLGLYLNGVEAREIERDRGFVRIAIGGDGLNAGVSGYVQEAYIAPAEASSAALPIVTFAAGEGEEIQLLRDYAEDAELVASYPTGAKAQLLGWMEGWCQVQIGEETGFVRTRQLDWPKDVEEGLRGVPVEHFDGLTSQEKHAMDIMNAYFDEKEAVYGPAEFWPIEVKAERAALSVQLGRGQVYDDGIDILPGPEDLTQEEAMAIVERVIQEYHDISPEELATYDVSARFYDSTLEATGHFWYFYFLDMNDPGRPIMHFTISSPGGEIWPY